MLRHDLDYVFGMFFKIELQIDKLDETSGKSFIWSGVYCWRFMIKITLICYFILEITGHIVIDYNHLKECHWINNHLIIFNNKTTLNKRSKHNMSSLFLRNRIAYQKIYLLIWAKSKSMREDGIKNRILSLSYLFIIIKTFSHQNIKESTFKVI